MSRLIPFPSCLPVVDECAAVFLPVPLGDAVASARRRHRSLIAAAGEWALAQGASLSPDHIALWAATGDDLGWPRGVTGTTGPWRVSHLPQLMASIATWCALADCSVPADLTASLWHLYGFLAGTGRLHPASDALTELRAAVVVFSPFDDSGPTAYLRPDPNAA